MEMVCEQTNVGFMNFSHGGCWCRGLQFILHIKDLESVLQVKSSALNLLCGEDCCLYSNVFACFHVRVDTVGWSCSQC